MRRLLASILCLASALALVAATEAVAAVPADDDVGLGQRCIVHLRVSGDGEVMRRSWRAGTGDEWVSEPAWRVRPGRPVSWETRGRRGSGCSATANYEGPGDQRFGIVLINHVQHPERRLCNARGTGNFHCSVTTRPRTPRTVEIDVHIRFGRP